MLGPISPESASLGLRRWPLRRSIALLAALTACTPEGTQASIDSEVHVVRLLELGRITEGVSEGFDLDGVVTSEGDPTGCGQSDHVDAEGRPGIDNALGSLLPILDLTEASVLGLLLQGAVTSGELLLMMEISTWEDGSETFRLLRGTTEPLVGTDGLLLAGQTFDLDPTISVAEPVPAERDDEGAVIATDFDFDLPLEILRAQLDLQFQQAAVRMGPADAEGRRKGVLAGGAPWAPIVEELNSTPIDESVKQILSSIVADLADLRPGPDGRCTAISASLSFETVPGFIYADQLLE